MPLSFKTKMFKQFSIVSVLILNSLALPAVAKDYKVELLVFENQTQSQAFEANNYDRPASMVSRAETWKIPPTMLLGAADSINRSSNYRLLQHYSWGQESLPSSRAAAYEAIDQGIYGWIKIYATDLLFADINIDVNGYRLTEKRRLKLNEKHFFDHPKFGLLLQVSRLEAQTEPVDETQSSDAKDEEVELLNNR